MTTKTVQHTAAQDSFAYRDSRFSGLVRPFLYVVDLLLIIVIAAVIFTTDFDLLTFSIFLGICWVVVSVQLEFYEVKRNTTILQLLGKLIRQSIFFLFITFAFFGYYYEIGRNTAAVLQYISWTMISIAVFKLAVYVFFKNYRKVLGGNLRTITILGKNIQSIQLEQFFKDHDDYGYKIASHIDVKNPNFSLDSFKQEILDRKIDEIFCSVQELTNEQLIEITDFADNNLRTLKFLPDTNAVLSKHLHYEYYGPTPILSLRQIPLDDPVNKVAKRAFDIVFSLLIIVFLLSWLIPIIAIIIKIESRGPVFFKQYRNGLDYKEFVCFKFRSMVPNKTADIYQVSRNDQRITSIGKFLRKTSIDEMPQFFNVLLGDMSVVGPRPHMVSHTHMYAERIDKFMVRHFVKPGITGLAQVSGYRGEVETEDDIKGRVRNDIYYIENWSTLMDVKIIFRTIFNMFQGEEKAY